MLLVCGRTLVLPLVLALLLDWMGREVLLRAGSDDRCGEPLVNVSGCSDGRGLRPVPHELCEGVEDPPDRRCCCWPAGYAPNPGGEGNFYLKLCFETCYM